MALHSGRLCLYLSPVYLCLLAQSACLQGGCTSAEVLTEEVAGRTLFVPARALSRKLKSPSLEFRPR